MKSILSVVPEYTSLEEGSKLRGGHRRYAQSNMYPVWARDGKHLIYVSHANAVYTIWWARTDGAGQPVKLLESRDAMTPGDLSPDGRRLVYRRFERWRRSHRGRLPIPEGLWASAAAAARQHGVFQTAKVLRLEYGKLKRMAEAANPGPQPTVPTAFLV